jgi:hypothetical protein
MINFNDLFETPSDKEFEARLQEIEKKYAYWFKDRKSRLYPKEPDTLRLHIITRFKGLERGINRDEGSDLPDMIFEECVDAFNSVYNKKLE